MTASDIRPGGVLAIWHDVVAGREAEIEHWYNHEHHAERVAVPGFRDARRHVALTGAPRYFVRYRTDSPEVLGSPAYRERVGNPSLWTQSTMPHYRNMCRNVCRTVARHGQGEGGIVVTARLAAGDRAAWTDARAGSLLARAAESRGLAGGELWQVEPALTRLPSQERQLRGGEDALVDRIAVIHASDEAAAAAAARWWRAEGPEGAGPVTGVYRLVFTLDRASA